MAISIIGKIDLSKVPNNQIPAVTSAGVEHTIRYNQTISVFQRCILVLSPVVMEAAVLGAPTAKNANAENTLKLVGKIALMAIHQCEDMWSATEIRTLIAALYAALLLNPEARIVFEIKTAILDLRELIVPQISDSEEETAKYAKVKVPLTRTERPEENIFGQD